MTNTKKLLKEGPEDYLPLQAKTRDYSQRDSQPQRNKSVGEKLSEDSWVVQARTVFNSFNML